MAKIKRMASLLLAMVMIVAAVGAMSVSSGAAGVFSGAKKMDALEYYSRKFVNKGDEFYYKIVLPSSGKITIRCANNSGYKPDGYLYNQNAEELAHNSSFGGGMSWEINKLKKGTYYLKLRGYSDDTSVTDFYYTFTPDEEPIIKLAVTMKKGETIQLGTITENYDGKVTWLSTKKDIASVSKGTVKALKKGQTTVRASLDNGTYIEIKVIVK